MDNPPQGRSKLPMLVDMGKCEDLWNDLRSFCVAIRKVRIKHNLPGSKCDLAWIMDEDDEDAEFVVEFTEEAKPQLRGILELEHEHGELYQDIRDIQNEAESLVDTEVTCRRVAETLRAKGNCSSFALVSAQVAAVRRMPILEDTLEYDYDDDEDPWAMKPFNEYQLRRIRGDEERVQATRRFRLEIVTSLWEELAKRQNALLVQNNMSLPSLDDLPLSEIRLGVKSGKKRALDEVTGSPDHEEEGQSSKGMRTS